MLDHNDYAKQFKNATVFPYEKFTYDMSKGNVIMLLIGFALSVFGGYGTIYSDSKEAGKLLFIGVALIGSALAYQCFPGFRKFFDGGSKSDIFDREFEDLLSAWKACGIVSEGASREDCNVAFYGKSGGMALFAVITFNLDSSKSSSNSYLFAHFNVFRKVKNRQGNKIKWIPLSNHFQGSDEELIEYLETLNAEVTASLREKSKTTKLRDMPDPADIPPLNGLVCRAMPH